MGNLLFYKLTAGTRVLRSMGAATEAKDDASDDRVETRIRLYLLVAVAVVADKSDGNAHGSSP